jgi:hypothetical protein
MPPRHIVAFHDNPRWKATCVHLSLRHAREILRQKRLRMTDMRVHINLSIRRNYSPLFFYFRGRWEVSHPKSEASPESEYIN